MKINVLLFAQARQIANADSVELSLKPDARVSDLKAALAGAVPELSDLLSRSSIAVNQQYAVAHDRIPESAEVAMIPPVSGG